MPNFAMHITLWQVRHPVTNASPSSAEAGQHSLHVAPGQTLFHGDSPPRET